MRFPSERMAEIKSLQKHRKLPDIRLLPYILIALLFAFSLQSQDSPENIRNKRKVELIYADEDIVLRDEHTGTDIHHIIGNVKFRMDESTLSCDSAHWLPDKMQISAFSRAHLEQGDTLNLFGDYMFYDGKTDIAVVKGNVELIDKETHLYTDAINYDVINQIADYESRGRITNADNTLTSIIGIYFVNQNLFHFKDSVKIVNPDYVMTSDTMDYNTKTETVHFTGPSEVRGDSIYMYCERGWYDTRTRISSIWSNAYIDNMKNSLRADSIFYNDSIGFGEGFRNVVIEDTTNNLFVSGNYAYYNKTPEKYFATDSALFIQVTNNDSLYLHADTLMAFNIPDTIKEYRLVKAFYKCRIFSKDIQAKCDSLTFSFQDTIIRLYHDPVIWSTENQLTADSMALFTKNQETDRLELYNSAFVTSKIDTLRYNQVKGDNLIAYFKDDKVYKIVLKGNGESIYYLLDGQELAGVNRSKSTDIQILMEEGKVSEVIENQNPSGYIDPPVSLSLKEPKLEGFSWLEILRPKGKTDIFRK
ncbi:MAG TPA: OstA-like protein [Bacteroidales bacterium]|nr:OstA-like protein [Bacteroidales bacterium]